MERQPPLPISDLHALHGAAINHFMLMRALGDRDAMAEASEREQAIRKRLFGKEPA